MFQKLQKSVQRTITSPGKWFFVAFLGTSIAAHAIEVEGSAPLGAGRLSSTQAAAIRDALDRATLQGETSVKGNTSSDKGNSLRVRGQAIASYSLLREWQQEDKYHVVVDVQFAKRALDTRKICAASDFRRKILTTNFHFQNPAQAPDINNFSEGLAAELNKRLFASGHYLPEKSPNESPLQIERPQSEPVHYPDNIRNMARRYGVQFVVGGIIRDASFEGERYTIGNGNDLRPSERKQIFNIPLLNFTKYGVIATASARRFEIELFVFDGISGALINRHTLSGRARGNVVMAQSFPMNTDRFFATDFGKIVDEKLSEAVQNIDGDVLCLPFSARITKVEKGLVYFDAGGTSLLAPGDELQIYRLKPGLLPIDAISQYQFARRGQSEEPVGTLTVSEVQPLFSAGIPDGNSKPEIGDYIRFVSDGSKR